jgi:hypothetical protein
MTSVIWHAIRKEAAAATAKSEEAPAKRSA